MRLAFTALVVLVACEGTDAPEGLAPTPDGPGARVSWELGTPFLPRIPFPNDVLTRPDPGARTGRRLALPRDSRTVFEDELRDGVNDLDGFGAGLILIPFEDELDLADLRRRQGPTATFTEEGFAAHAIYLIDLETGLPVPLALGAPFEPAALVRPDGYHPADPREGEPSLLFETVDEDGSETDFDGTDDRPNTIDGLAGRGGDLVDRITAEWERETRTLVLRPLTSLRPGATYAVVVSRRLRDAAGHAVRSALPFVHPLGQKEALRPLVEHFAAHPELYGDLASLAFEGVAFAWSFTVQTTTEDLGEIARGLEGEGRLAFLAEEFPPQIVPHPVSGGLPGRPCPDPGAARYRAPAAVWRSALEASAAQIGLDAVSRDALVASYDHLESVVAFAVEVPHLLGDPENRSPIARFRPDLVDLESGVRRETIVALALLPRADDGPATPLMWLHDAGDGKVDGLAYAGLLLRHGLAPVLIDAPEHGLDLGAEARVALLNVFGNQCLAPLAEALVSDRVADFDGDDAPDPGALAHGPDPFHARDLRRQWAIDHLIVARALRSFDGRISTPTSTTIAGRREPLEFDGDYDRDGDIDPAGDWNGDGSPDLGGTSAIAGIGMGANVAMLTAAVSPHVSTTTLVSPAAGLARAWMRSADDRVRAGALSAVLGPVVWTRTSDGPGAESACAAGEVSLRMSLPDTNHGADTEVACLGASDASPGATLVVRDLTNGYRGCARLDAGARSFVPMQADSGDRWSFDLYAADVTVNDFEDCTPEDADAVPVASLETFGVESGPPGDLRCPECARYRRVEYAIGTPLIVPAGGLGLRRQSPGIVRYQALLDTVLHAADPGAHARSAAASPTLVVATAGDGELPFAAAVRLGRSVGALPFLPPGAPSHLSAFVAESADTPHDTLTRLHAIEGAPFLERTPAVGGPRFVADPDDLSEGRARFASDGSPSVDGARPITPSRPVRARHFTIVYVAPEGAHGPSPALLFSETTPFDASQYLINHVGRFSSTGGGEIRHLDAPMDHLCFADSSCDLLRE